MGLFDQFPYTNFHELNLDWLIRLIKELENTVNNFVALNTIKYADPIQWNITTQYEANTVVVDPQTGTAYISSKAVPAGVALTNTEYWSVIFTLDIISANKNLTLRDDGSNVLATFASAAGDWLLWNGTLYKVSQTINVNEAYVAGYNLDRYTIEQFIDDLRTEIIGYIGDLDDLDTQTKTDIVAAINELCSGISDITDAYIDNNIINVLYHGISNDGVTDIAEDLETLINDAPLHSVIFFPPGLYYFSRGITITNSVTLLGCSDHYTQVPRNDKTTTTFLSTPIANGALITFSGAYNHAISHISFYSDSLSVVTNEEPPAGTPRLHFEFPVSVANYSCIKDLCNTVGNKYDSVYIHGYSGTALYTSGGYSLIESCFIYTCGLGLYMQRDGQVSNTFIEFCENGAEFHGGISVVNTRIEEIGKTAVKTVGSCKYSNVTIDQVGYAGLDLIDWAFGINFSGKITRCGQYYFSLTYAQFLAIADADRIDSAYSLIYANNIGNKANLFILGEDNGYEAWDDLGTNKKPIYVLRGASGCYVNNTVIMIPHTTLFTDLPESAGLISWIVGAATFRTSGSKVVDKYGGMIAAGDSITFDCRGFNAVYTLMTRYSGSVCQYILNTNTQGTAVFATPAGTEVSTMQVTTSGNTVTITNTGSGNGYYCYDMFTPDQMY